MYTRPRKNGDKIMTQSKQQMGPGGFTPTPMDESQTPTGQKIGTLMPSALPPENIERAEDELLLAVPSIVGTADTAKVPSLPLEGVTSDVSTWQDNKRISGLWSSNYNRNSWVNVANIGWKKLANNSNSAIVALSMLSAHAKEKGSRVRYCEDSDGMISEMYVW